MSLFQTANTTDHLVEFNAGKCIVEGNWIKPDLRKGKIYMDQGADHLLHFYWKERKNQATNEEDLIIFPDEAEFTQVAQCETGRVYLLKFKSSNEHHFFWMQSKDASKDQEIVERVNGLIRDPESSMDNPAPFDDASQADMMRLLSSVDGQDPSLTQENILEFLQNIGRRDSSMVTSIESNASASNDSQEALDQLEDLISNAEAAADASITLSNDLVSQQLPLLFRDAQYSSAVFPFLDENERSVDAVETAAFIEGLSKIQAALGKDDIDGVISQLELDPSAKNSVEAFLAALVDKVKEKNEDAMDED